MSNNVEKFCDQQFKEFEQFANAQLDGLKSRLDPNGLEYVSVCLSIESLHTTTLASQKRILETYTASIMAADHSLNSLGTCLKMYSISTSKALRTNGKAVPKD